MEWKFTLSSVASWEEMYTACEQAKHSIDFEQYIFWDDDIGRRFSALLIRKAKEGIKVRLLWDTLGSFNMIYAKDLGLLKESGAEVVFFAPFNPLILTFKKWIYRDHKKMLIVDEEMVYTGGVGIQQPFAGWRDTNVSLRGPMVTQAIEDFNRMWLIAKRHHFIRFPRREFVDQFKLVNNSPRRGQKHLYSEVIKAIETAKQYVYLTTPYFIPSIRLMHALKRAARRGVEIRLLLPLVSDVTWVNISSQDYFSRLLKYGVRVYQYKDKMIHTKSIVADDTWGTVGSFNLDNLSFHFNYEANVVTTNQLFIAELKSHFENDLTQAKEVTWEEWRARPLKQKILERLTRPFHPIL